MSSERYKKGKKIRDESFGKEGLERWEDLYKICPTHADAIHDYCFGTIPNFNLYSRRVCTRICRIKKRKYNKL